MTRPRSHRAPSPRRLHLETLEGRRLLSASVIDLPRVSVDATHATDHILVRFRDGTVPVPLSGTTLGKAHALVPNLYDVNLGSGMTVDQALAAYRTAGIIEYAEADLTLEVVWTPNDAQFGQQWDMQNTGQDGGTRGADIRAGDAWGVTNGAKALPIAVMDTGIDYTHRDLYLNIWLNQGEIPASRRANLLDADGDGRISFRDLNDSRNQGAGKITDLNANGYIDGGDLLRVMTKDTSGRDTGAGGWADGLSQDGDRYIDDLIGWNSNANTNDPMDGYGHGTHVAGTIGAVGNNGIGVAGVNWVAQLVAVKFFDNSGNGSVSQFIDGLDYALAKGIKISNNSWNDAGYTPSLFDAVKRTRDRGHLFVAAAGNSGRNTDAQPAYPAGFALDNIISVAATDRYDRLAGFSNYGATSVDIAAPGVDILSTNPGNNYGNRSGTSMATPHVTGVAALVWSLHPDWNYQQVIAQVLNTAVRLPSLDGKVASGRLDAAAAVGFTQTTTPPATQPTLKLVDSKAGGAAGTISKITVKFDVAPTGGAFPATSVSVTGPDGSAIAVTGMTLVPNSGGLVFDLTFAAQTRAGYYKLIVGGSTGPVAAFNSSFYLAPGAATSPTLKLVDSKAGGAAGTISKITVKFDVAPTGGAFPATSVSVTGPDGSAIAVTGMTLVPNSGGLVFDLTFAAQTRAGYYKLIVGGSTGPVAAFNSSFYLAPGAATSPALRLVDSKAGGAAGTISKITVKFDRAPSGGTFPLTGVTLTGPDGKAIAITGMTLVANSSGLVFDLTFAVQTRPGYYKLNVGDATGPVATFSSSLYLAPL